MLIKQFVVLEQIILRILHALTLFTKFSENEEERKPHVCEHCSKRFTRTTTLNLHMKRKHKSKYYRKLFVLRFLIISGASADERESFTKPHKCEKCGKRFTAIMYLKRHIRRLHLGILFVHFSEIFYSI